MNVLNIKCKKSESRDISIIKKPLNKTLKSKNGNITKTNIYKSCRAKNGISDIYTSFFDCGNAKYKKKNKEYNSCSDKRSNERFNRETLSTHNTHLLTYDLRTHHGNHWIQI